MELTDGDIHEGGYPEDVLEFGIKNGGILAESVYPFKGKVGPCKFKQGLGVTIDGWMKIKPNSELSLKYALAFEPVIVHLRFEPWMLVDGLLTETRKYSMVFVLVVFRTLIFLPYFYITDLELSHHLLLVKSNFNCVYSFFCIILLTDKDTSLCILYTVRLRAQATTAGRIMQ